MDAVPSGLPPVICEPIHIPGLIHPMAALLVLAGQAMTHCPKSWEQHLKLLGHRPKGNY